jgi:hypothetical protein
MEMERIFGLKIRGSDYFVLKTPEVSESQSALQATGTSEMKMKMKEL